MRVGANAASGVAAGLPPNVLSSRIAIQLGVVVVSGCVGPIVAASTDTTENAVPVVALISIGKDKGGAHRWGSSATILGAVDTLPSQSSAPGALIKTTLFALHRSGVLVVLRRQRWAIAANH